MIGKNILGENMQYKMKNSITVKELSNEDRRKMQANILEIMIEFDRICRKNHITYSIDGGTFLGAVRHKGFIPWDVDADFVIMRKDYNRFREICKTQLDSNRFFLQDETTDPHYRWGYARILRKNTKYIRAGHEHMKSQNGVFIDIFTLDSVPDMKILRYIHKFLCFCIRKILWSEVGKKVHPNIIIRKWFLILSLIPRNWIFKQRDRLAAKCNKNPNTQLIRHMCSPHPKKYSYGFPRSLFDEIIDYQFEGYNFMGFADYNWYLKSIYNDYMKLPEMKDRISHIPCSYYKFI